MKSQSSLSLARQNNRALTEPTACQAIRRFSSHRTSSYNYFRVQNRRLL